MSQSEVLAFNNVVTEFQNQYPSAEIEYIPNGMCSAVVYDEYKGIRDRSAFNTDGYNLLYCITQLSRLLGEKLR